MKNMKHACINYTMWKYEPLIKCYTIHCEAVTFHTHNPNKGGCTISINFGPLYLFHIPIYESGRYTKMRNGVNNWSCVE